MSNTPLSAMANHANFDFALACVRAGTSPLMVGPAGCGKTSIARRVAAEMGIDFYYTGAVESAFMLRGFRDAHGNVEETSFVKAYKNGGLFLFDEIDASDPAALVSIHAGLDNGVFDTPAGVIERHPDFHFIGAANTWGNGATLEYMGRNHLDSATLDRFITISMDYDQAFERALITERHPRQMGWADIVLAAREAVRDLSIKHVVSTRAHLQGAVLLDARLNLQLIKESVLWRGLPHDSKVKLEEALKLKLDSLFTVGQKVANKGILMGDWRPKDRDGNRFATFRVFAAPSDLTNRSGTKIRMTYRQAVEEVGKLRNWHGHNGEVFENETALRAALQNGKALGKWFIPTGQMLHKRQTNGKGSYHLFGLQGQGDFAGTFTSAGGNPANNLDSYWSSSERQDNPAEIYVVRFSDGTIGWRTKDDSSQFLCRPCRVELAL